MNLYNIKKENFKRRIDIADINSLSKSTKPGCNEFVVHVNAQYDYRFDSTSRDEIFDAIKYVCWRQRKANLVVYEVPDSLKEHHTRKKDISNGNEIRPPAKYKVVSKEYPEGDIVNKLATEVTAGNNEIEITDDMRNFSDEIQREHSDTVY